MRNERSLEARLLGRVRVAPLLSAWKAWRLATSAAKTARRSFDEATSCQAASTHPNPNLAPTPTPTPTQAR